MFSNKTEHLISYFFMKAKIFKKLFPRIRTSAFSQDFTEFAETLTPLANSVMESRNFFLKFLMFSPSCFLDFSIFPPFGGKNITNKNYFKVNLLPSQEKW